MNMKPEEDKKDKAAETPGALAIAKPVMSKGEKWFNWGLYQGMNYWLNLGISLVVTDVFLHGKGKHWFKSGVENATHTLTSTTGMKRSNAKWLSEIGLGTFSLNSGGNILLIPTKFIEDQKREWVYWLNDQLGVDQTTVDGRKLTPKEIYIEQEQDKQSWLRMIGRRVLGWSMTTGVGLTLDQVLAKKLPSPIMVDGELRTHKPGQQVFTEAAVGMANSVLNQCGPAGQQVAANPAVQRYMGYAALDWIYTIITSKVLHATNGAHKQQLPGEVAVASTAASAMPDETGEQTGTNKKAAEIVRNKAKDETFAATASRKAEAANSYQLGA